MKTIIRILFLVMLHAPLWSYSYGKSDTPLFLIIVSDDYANSPSIHQFINFREQSFNVQTVTGTSIGTTKDDYRIYIET